MKSKTMAAQAAFRRQADIKGTAFNLPVLNGLNRLHRVGRVHLLPALEVV